MLKVEREYRKSRKNSIDEKKPAPSTNETSKQSDFSKKMMYIFDSTELEFRLKEQMFGNMALIVELYKYNLIKSNIITMCIDDMFEEINGQNVEILCKMLNNLAQY